MLKAGWATDLNFHFYGYLVNNIRASLDYPTRKKQQHGGIYRLSVGSERSSMSPPISIVSVIYTVHPSTATRTQSKTLHGDMQYLQLGGMLGLIIDQF